MAEPAKIVAAAWGRYPDISFLLLKAKDINRASLPAAIHEKLSLACLHEAPAVLPSASFGGPAGFSP